MITWGCSLRNAAARSRRSAIPYSTSPSVMIEKLDLGYADDRGAAALFLHPQRADLVRSHAGDTCLAPGREQVGDVFPLAGPPGHGGGDAVFEIVWVSHHRDGPVPVLRHRLHPRHPFPRRCCRNSLTPQLAVAAPLPTVHHVSSIAAALVDPGAPRGEVVGPVSLG